MRGTPLNVSFGRATGTVNFHSNSVLVSTSKMPFRHCSNSLLADVISTHRMDMLHSKRTTSICVPRSVVGHLLTSDIHFTDFHFPCMISDLVMKCPTTSTNLRMNSDVARLSKGSVTCCSFGRRVLGHGGTGTSRRMALACIHGNIASALDVVAGTSCRVNMTTHATASGLLPIIHGRCDFLSSFPTNMSLKMGALGNCMNRVGCLFSGRKTGRLKNFKAVNDVFPTA